MAGLAGGACTRGRAYELRGQVLGIDPDRRELTIKHEDIRGYMPGMTMAFPVRDERLMRGREPGELIRATLIVDEGSAYLSRIERTGFAPYADPGPVAGTILQPGDQVPDAVLIDQTGRTRRLADWRGTAVAVAFIYTRCPFPNFCPLMDRQFAAIQQQVAADASLRGRVHLLSVSFDPEHDTPKVLAAHAARVSADPAHWTFVTGDRDQVQTLTSRFGISVIRSDKPDEIAHNLRTAVIDPHGRVVTVVSGGDWTPPEMVAHLRTALAR